MGHSMREKPASLIPFFEMLDQKLAASQGYSIYVDICGRKLELRFPAKEQAAIIERCLAGHIIQETPAPDALFHFWTDDYSRYVSNRSAAEQWRCKDESGWILYTPESRLLGARLAKRTFYYCKHASLRPAPFPYWAASSLVCQWAGTECLLPVHGAAVGTGGKGVLLAAKGGGGKSTLAASCLLAGMELVSDDFLLLNTQGPVLAMPLFSMIKINPDMKTRLPLGLPLIWEDASRGGKQVLDASAIPLCQELPVCAVIFLELSGRDEPVISPPPPGPVSTRLIQTVLQQTGVYDPAATAAILKRLSGLPAYEMSLSRNSEKNAETLRTFVERML